MRRTVALSVVAACLLAGGAIAAAQAGGTPATEPPSETAATVETGKAVAKQVGQDLMNAEAKEEGKVAEPLSVGGSPDPASDPDLRSGRMPDPVSSPPPKACPQP